IELAKSAGFPVEEHRTVTEDGYLIVLHRIPPLASIREQRVVIYIHGLFASSLDMVIRGRKMGFGYQLSEAGFDVWLPNLRGSTDNPITVNVTKNNPWDFSWDENARYDFPAIMDYVLATTGTRKVSTIGMSMAANVVLGGVALRPQYNQRLGCMVFFAPTARMKYTTSFVQICSSSLAMVSGARQTCRQKLNESTLTNAYPTSTPGARQTCRQKLNRSTMTKDYPTSTPGARQTCGQKLSELKKPSTNNKRNNVFSVSLQVARFTANKDRQGGVNPKIKVLAKKPPITAKVRSHNEALEEFFVKHIEFYKKINESYKSSAIELELLPKHSET
ncbi:lipase 1-like, partial [Homalodisca vitripennis]|uniref:lipase 1-like n=1 Tax=Homalodisca vitripennis TaxID=197043 RepID=UPI001EEBB243